MSNFLAIGAVTALLKDLLNEGLTKQGVAGKLGTEISVGALPPDLIENETNGEPQINLFLSQVTPNSGWRNMDLPSLNGKGEGISNPPLALDLHYLLTAYGRDDLHAEILLGCAMQLLHEIPVLTRAVIRQKQQTWSSGDDELLQALATANLADQAEQIKISPHSIGAEEMSKVWTAFQAHYRPTVAYQVTVVLIESQRPGRNPLPVLTRGSADSGVVSQPNLTPPFSTLTAVKPPNKQVSAQLDDVLTLEGHHLDGSDITVRFTDPRLRRVLEADPLPGNTASQMTVRLLDAVDPDVPANTPPDPPEKSWSAGFYSVAVFVQRPDETFHRATNDLPFALAPTISLAPTTQMPDVTVGKDADNNITFTVECGPEVRPEQRAALLVGNLEIPSQPHPVQTHTLTFVAKSILLARSILPGDYFVRLRVDGVDSLLVNRAVTPPVFFDNQKVTIP